MGCDIHAHIEVKIQGQWRHWTVPRIARHYVLFAKMANIRNVDKGSEGYIEPMFEPRGLPEDITFETKYASEYMGEDGHSHSYIENEDFIELINWYNKLMKDDEYSDNWLSWEYETIGFFLGNGYDIFTYPESFPKDVTGVRIVFWFDN